MVHRDREPARAFRIRWSHPAGPSWRGAGVDWAVFESLGSNDAGLSDLEAAARLETFGANMLHSQTVTVFGILLRQLRNPLLVLLLVAAGISILTGDVTDGAIIGAIVVLSVGLGFVNEYRSARAVAALHGDIHYDALAWPGGAQRKVDVTTLVPGDVVALRVGDVVPADLRVLETNQLECDEAVLTGGRCRRRSLTRRRR